MVTYQHAMVSTSLGELLMVSNGEALTGVYFEDTSTHAAADRIGGRVGEREDAVLARAADEMREYLAGERRDFEIPVHLRGDDFSQQVWRLLAQIPYGATTTYGAIAQQLGNRRMAQRVGQAVGHNPVSIIIPCHRVVGADGSLTGFAGGIDRKRTLLDLEEPAETAAMRLF